MCAMYSFENSVVEAPNNNLSAKLGLAAARFHYGGSKATEVFTNGKLKLSFFYDEGKKAARLM